MADTLLSRLCYDGNQCNPPIAPAEEQSVLFLSGEAENEEYRLSTFRRFSRTSTALPNRLASAGFYFTGQQDIVKCFSCGQCVENMTRNDDPSDRKFHRPDCLQAGGNDPRNIPTHTSSNIFGSLLAGLRTSQNNAGNHSNTTTNSSNNNQRNRNSEMHRPIYTAPVVAQSGNEEETVARHPTTSRSSTRSPSRQQLTDRDRRIEIFPCTNPVNRQMRNVRTRRDTFDGSRWPRQRIIASPLDIADAGFFYLGDRDKVRCWYCNGGLENWECDDDPWTEHAKWFPTCEFLLRERGPDFVHEVTRRFPNLRRINVPVPGIIRPSRPRPGISRQWNIGPRNATNGPTSFTINSPGMQINVRNSRIGGQPPVNVAGTYIPHLFEINQRATPQIVDPQQAVRQYEQTVSEAMRNSPLVTQAREMGFPNDVIKMVLLNKCEENNRLFDNFDDMLESLMLYQEEAERMEQQLPNPVPEFNNDNEPSAASSSPGVNQSSEAAHELTRLEQSRNCRMCHRERASVVLLPCAHVALCNNCAVNGVRICPICKRLVRENIRSYLS